MVDWKSHLERAVRIKGSQNRLAEAMGCSQSKVSWLLVTAKEITVEDALLIDRATDGEVSKADLRPDWFSREQASAS